MSSDQFQDYVPYRPSRRRDPRRKLMGWGILAAVVLVIVIVFVVSHQWGSPTASGAVATATPQPAASTASAPAATTPAVAATPAPGATGATPAIVDPNAMDQPTRKALVLKLIHQGVFTAVLALANPPRVGVTDIFRGLSPDLQTQFLGTVDSYVHNGAPSTDALQLIDPKTGKTVGTYTAAGGVKYL